MSKHKLILVGVIFLIVLLVVLVYCFFEKRERVIEENIQQLETSEGNSMEDREVNLENDLSMKSSVFVVYQF